MSRDRSSGTSPPVASKPTTRFSKPVSESQRTDPRQFQLNQLRRRFSPGEKEQDEATALTFKVVPSDPDFPFEMTDLRCTLLVPRAYPASGRPSLRVTNPGMDRGYQINVERGFESLVTMMPQSTLLTLINELDKRLEGFLTSEKAQTVKLVTYTEKGTPTAASGVPAPSSKPMAVSAVLESSLASSSQQHTAQEISEAQSRRALDLRQLEARMGRQPFFSKSSDGLSFSLSLPISKPHELPPSLQSIQSVKLFVPLSYNLEPCTVTFAHVPSDIADAVQTTFKRHATAHPEMTLMAHVNHLAQNIRSMATEALDPGPATPSAPSTTIVETASPPVKDAAPGRSSDRPHVQIVPRPPEWDTPRDDDTGSDSSDGVDSEDEASEYVTDEEGGAVLPVEARAATETGPDLGILLSFPALELYGAETLQLYSVSLTVKCDRCKDMRDVKNLRSRQQGDNASVKHESCQKCASPLSIGYRPELMHSNSVKAGYLDLDGCAVVDLLPSKFIPTCSQCSTPAPVPGVVSFRGESTMAMCRECHQRMSFKIPDLKFLRVSAASTSRQQPLPRKRLKENLGIVSGQELPQRGRCEHYAKSYRWFRFSCCSKVYPCDRCHDAAEEHPNEHANRMICGFCSREQIYRPEDCIHCHNSLVRKRGGGFWEGGKGTRDKTRMSRKDPRKYKRRAGGAAVVGTGKNKTKK